MHYLRKERSEGKRKQTRLGPSSKSSKSGVDLKRKQTTHNSKYKQLLDVSCDTGYEGK